MGGTIAFANRFSSKTSAASSAPATTTSFLPAMSISNMGPSSFAISISRWVGRTGSRRNTSPSNGNRQLGVGMSATAVGAVPRLWSCEGPLPEVGWSLLIGNSFPDPAR